MSDPLPFEVDRRVSGFTRLKFTADISLGKTYQGHQKRDDEVLSNYVRAASIQPNGLTFDDQRMWMSPEELRRYRLRSGDVLIVEGGAGYGRSAVVDRDMPGWGFQNHVIRVRPAPAWYGPFLNWAIKGQFAAGLIDVVVDGATIPALSSDKARELPVLNIPLPEQRRLADYLDRETAEIDAMDAELDRLVETLRERKLSSLRGLGHRLNGPGQRVGLGRLLEKQSRPVAATDGVITAFRDGQVTLRANRREDGFTLSSTESGYQGIEPHDFVFHGLDGFSGAVGVSDARGKASPVYHVCTATEFTSERFMAWALRAMAASGQLEAYAWSVRQRSVDFRNWNTFAGLPITYVPLDEQLRIVAELDEQTARIDDMIADAQRLKALLAERRSTLITEVVTGKKEVPA